MITTSAVLIALFGGLAVHHLHARRRVSAACYAACVVIWTAALLLQVEAERLTAETKVYRAWRASQR